MQLVSQPSVVIIGNYNFVAGGVDYNFEPTVTFLAGVTSVLFNISIIDDDVMEGNEYFRLSIDTDDLPLGVFDSALVTIIDDDDDNDTGIIGIGDKSK